MIQDRIIEPATLVTDGVTTSVEVRMPWYRALPASCIAGVTFAVDGVAAPPESLRWTMNGQTSRLADLADNIESWWFPTDSATVTGAIPVGHAAAAHRVDIGLQLHIPYIVTAHGVLRIDEHDSKTMAALERRS